MKQDKAIANDQKTQSPSFCNILKNLIDKSFFFQKLYIYICIYIYIYEFFYYYVKKKKMKNYQIKFEKKSYDKKRYEKVMKQSYEEKTMNKL